MKLPKIKLPNLLKRKKSADDAESEDKEAVEEEAEEEAGDEEKPVKKKKKGFRPPLPLLPDLIVFELDIHKVRSKTVKTRGFVGQTAGTGINCFEFFLPFFGGCVIDVQLEINAVADVTGLEF